MAENPGSRWRPTRGRLISVGLVGICAVALSTGTVLGLRWAATPHRASAAPGVHATALPDAPLLGFVRINQPAPALNLPLLRGHGNVTISRLAGRPIVINFWHS